MGSNWLFTGSPSSSERAAAIISLIQFTKLNEMDSYAGLKDASMGLSLARFFNADQGFLKLA